jgi:hypothetical protein
MHTRRQFLLASAATGAVTACTTTGGAARAGRHIVLVGDSIFDNASYVPGQPSVIEQLAGELGDADRATLLARDGDVTRDVHDQLGALPADATHVVVSVGGNDALQHTDLLHREIANSAELLTELARIQAGFRARYREMLDAVLRCGKPTVVCTIYDSNYEAPRKQLADVALSVWNDVIVRCAAEVGVPVIDLRRIFRAPADYANPIEPSAVGGKKMVAAIVAVTAAHDFTSRRTAIHP